MPEEDRNDANDENNQTEEFLTERIISGYIPQAIDLQDPTGVGVTYIKPKPGIAEMRENARSDIAKLLFVLLFLVAIWAMGIFSYDPSSRESLKDLVSLLFTPIVGILGTVLGFYFGAQTVNKS